MIITQASWSEANNLPGVAFSVLNSGQFVANHVFVDVVKLKKGSSLPLSLRGRHRRLYVVSGHGRVTGADGVEHPIGPDILVEWDRDETQSAVADSGIVAVMVEEHS
ncbi:hypothetical protein [Flaviflexus huanghaiensis]|uniref:hypothetical protein n=1 Tax=Flaviflexus huanghaiensis TaxID=1111473 RepID=UPI0015FA7D69|nr:hypothetical protein [Flaviflexus huanghaiensis]